VLHLVGVMVIVVKKGGGGDDNPTATDDGLHQDRNI
jgi:hypothetical protein